VVALILGSGGLVPPSEQQGAGVLARGYAFVVVGLRWYWWRRGPGGYITGPDRWMTASQACADGMPSPD
jgi:hypothetical protein